MKKLPYVLIFLATQVAAFILIVGGRFIAVYNEINGCWPPLDAWESLVRLIL